MTTQELKIVEFKSQPLFERWLGRSFDKSPGVWLRIYKKDSGAKTVSYQEALEVALCFGWIDGQRKSYDAISFLQRFTPRRSKSLWSKRNTLIVEQLVKQGRMKTAGLHAVEQAKADSLWDKAYASSKNMEVPADLLAAVKRDKVAHVFFKSLSKANLYSIYFKLQTAKTEATRSRRLEAIVEMLRKQKKFS